MRTPLLAFILILLPPAPANWGLMRVGKLAADGSSRTSDGTGVGIYIIGTGVNSQHDDFIGSDGRSRVTYVGDFLVGAIGARATREVDAHDGFDGHETTWRATRQEDVRASRRTPGFTLCARRGRVTMRMTSTAAGIAVAAAIQTSRLPRPSTGSAARTRGTRPRTSGRELQRRPGQQERSPGDIEATDAGYLFTLSGNTGGAVEFHFGGSCDVIRPSPASRQQALVVGGTTEQDTPLGSGYGNCWDSTRLPRGCTGRARDRIDV